MALFISFTIQPQKMTDDLLNFKNLIVAKHPSRGVVNAVGRQDFLTNLDSSCKGKKFAVPFVKLFDNLFLDPKPHILKRRGHRKGYTKVRNNLIRPPLGITKITKPIRRQEVSLSILAQWIWRWRFEPLRLCQRAQASD